MSVIVERRRTGWMGERAAVEPARVEEATLAFDEMFTRYHGRIYGYLLGMVGDAEQAQDLTQDTFLKAYKALPRTPDLVLPAWLYRIATNTALDALRHRRRLTWLPFAPGDEERWAAPGADPLRRARGRARHPRPADAAPARLPATARPRWALRQRDRARPEPVADERQGNALPRQGAFPRGL